MTNVDLMNKVLTDEELNLVAGGRPQNKTKKQRDGIVKIVLKNVRKAFEILFS